MADVLVVGGGLIGLLTARELSLAGYRVTLLERGAIGVESSWAGGGILAPLYPWRYPDAVAALAAWSQAHYAQLVQDLTRASGIDAQWTRSGMLILDPAEHAAAEAWAHRYEVDLQLLEDAAAIAACEPALASCPAQAYWLPAVAQVRNPRLCKALRAALPALGVRLQEGVTVQGLVRDNAQVNGVQTDHGVYRAGAVVVAGGAWSGQLLAGFGVRLPVNPVRGQMLLYRAPPGTLRRIILEGGRYMIPRRDGHVLVGSTMEEMGFDKSVTVAARRDLQAMAQHRVPAVARHPVVGHWAGLRPGSPHGIPFIGPIATHPGLYVNSGHFRNGVVLAPASARLLVDLMVGRTPILQPAAYAPAQAA